MPVTGGGEAEKAVCLHVMQSAPRVLANTLVADGATRRTLAYAFIAFVGVTLLLTAWPVVEYSRRSHAERAVLLLPQAIPISTPIALSLGIICAYGPGLSRRQTRG